MAEARHDSNRSVPVADLFNTLTLPVDRSMFHASLTEMARAVGVDSEGFAQAWFDTWRERFSRDYPTAEADVRSVCNVIRAQVETEGIRKASQIRAEFARRTLQPRPDAVATLARLRALGIRTALISDCSPPVPALWPATPFAQGIEVPLFSCAEGLIKPDPALYLRACERLGVAPEACVYVGDGGNGELTGADHVGMRAILIATPSAADAYDTERTSWRGEAIEALGELPGLITGAEAAADD